MKGREDKEGKEKGEGIMKVREWMEEKKREVEGVEKVRETGGREEK